MGRRHWLKDQREVAAAQIWAAFLQRCSCSCSWWPFFCPPLGRQVSNSPTLRGPVPPHMDRPAQMLHSCTSSFWPIFSNFSNSGQSRANMDPSPLPSFGSMSTAGKLVSFRENHRGPWGQASLPSLHGASSNTDSREHSVLWGFPRAWRLCVDSSSLPGKVRRSARVPVPLLSPPREPSSQGLQT